MDEGSLEQALEYILFQQFLSSEFRIYDRTKNSTLLVAGTKAVIKKIEGVIKEGFAFVLSGKFDKFISFLSETFRVPEAKLQKKLDEMTNQDFEVDARLKFIQVVGAVREHYQDLAYKNVITQVRTMVSKKLHTGPGPTDDEVNTILSTHFGPDFSLMVNLFVVRAWSKLTGIHIKFRGPRMTMLNKLVAGVISMLNEPDQGKPARKERAPPKASSLPGPPGPLGPPGPPPPQ